MSATVFPKEMTDRYIASSFAVVMLQLMDDRIQYNAYEFKKYLRDIEYAESLTQEKMNVFGHMLSLGDYSGLYF